MIIPSNIFLSMTVLCYILELPAPMDLDPLLVSGFTLAGPRIVTYNFNSVKIDAVHMVCGSGSM